jgi:sugar-specific transcriptional regulator TrmB
MAVMDAQLISNIEDLGLSNKEARIYVASLMLGPSGVQSIADYSGIKRVTTYVILESLVSLGLVSQSVKGKKTLFIAEDPTNLRRLLDKREQEVKEQKQGFEAILPELLGLKTLPKDSPNVKFYDTPEGIRGLFGTFFDTYEGKPDMVYGVSNLDQLHAFFPEIKEANTNPQRLRKQIKSKFIYTSSRGPIYHDGDAAMGRDSRFIPADKFPFKGDFSIIGDHIIMISFTVAHPLAITIKSQELAAGMRAIFNLLWEQAALYGKDS